MLYISGILLFSVVAVVITTVRLKWNPLVALLAVALLAGLLQGKAVPDILAVMSRGFGAMAEGIGIIVALGAMIGVCLEESSAAHTLAKRLMQVSGPATGSLSMALLSALVGIPVFADSGFMMLAAPARQMAFLQGQHNAVMPLATATGLYSTHVLVPPTPGPLAAAANLGLSDALGTVVLTGLAATLPALFAAYAWVRVKGSRMQIATSPVPENPAAGILQAPGVIASLLPILIPVLLIMAGNFAKTGAEAERLNHFLRAAGHPIIALSAGLACCLLLPGARQRQGGFMSWIGKAVNQAGPIVLITAAGGSFGAVLKMLPVDTAFPKSGQDTDAGWWLLLIGFALAGILKTAQGSSTAAMIIASSLLAPLMPAYGIGGNLAPALLVCAIGGGAMMVSHGNDSYFWVISKFGGMTTKDTLMGFSLATVWMGLATLAFCCLGWLLFI